MKRSAYIFWGAVALVAIIAFALNAKRVAEPGSGLPPSPGSPTAAPPGYIAIHVREGGPSVWYSSPTTTVSSEIEVDSPPTNTTATSPLAVSGKARGSWFFEATMPIFLTDARGRILAQGTVRAQSDWTTSDFVPFLGTLAFPRQPTGSTGAFVLRNDDPSGDPSKLKEVDILVTFE